MFDVEDNHLIDELQEILKESGEYMYSGARCVPVGISTTTNSRFFVIYSWKPVPVVYQETLRSCIQEILDWEREKKL